MSLKIISIKNEIIFSNVNITGCLVYASSILDTSTFTCVPAHMHTADLSLYKCQVKAKKVKPIKIEHEVKKA